MILYFHRNPTTKEIFYVGIGQSERRANEMKSGRNIYWLRYVAKYGRPIVEIVHNGLSKDEACRLEIHYIGMFKKKIDGGMLVNLSNGGEISSLGVKRSAEVRARISAAQIGRIPSDETREKHRSIQNTPEMIALQRSYKIGKKQSIEMVEKRIAGMRGHVVSDETRAKISSANSGKVRSEETRRKLSEFQKGKPRNAELVKKSAESNKKPLLNSLTGIFYNGFQEAADSVPMKVNTLRSKLAGYSINNTPFVYA